MAMGTQLEMNSPPVHDPLGDAPGSAQWTGRLAALKTRAQLRWAEMEPRQRLWAIAAAVLLVAVATVGAAALLPDPLQLCCSLNYQLLYTQRPLQHQRQQMKRASICCQPSLS